MLDGAAWGGTLTMGPPRALPELVTVTRRGPLLRPARGASPELGTFGLDLTAGCGHGCAYCHIRGSQLFPGEGRVLFDPGTAARLAETLDGMDRLPGLVVLSPTSDPLPFQREVRAETLRVVRILLDREIDVAVLTRGRVPKELVALLAEHPDRTRVAVGVTTLGHHLGRLLEPRAAAPRARLRGLARLVEAGVPVEARLEPLIAGLTDTRENLKPLFDGLARAGVRRVVAHYLFQHPAMLEPLADALAPLGLAERLIDDYQGGPVFAVGSLGSTKHLPPDARREGFARIFAWGAEHGLIVQTGAAQNPDFHRGGPEYLKTAVPDRKVALSRA